MVSYPKRALSTLILLLIAVSCTNQGGVVKVQNFKGDKAFMTSADMRMIFRVKPKDIPESGKVTPEYIICAEPSPDVVKAVSDAFSASSSLGVKGLPSGIEPEVAAAVSRAHAESIAQLTERLATIQLLRDTLYRACEAYANGAISSTAYTIMLSRYDDIMITMLLGEFAAGAFGRSMAALGTGAEGEASALLDIQEKRESTRNAEETLNRLDKRHQEILTASETAKKAEGDGESKNIQDLEKKLENSSKQVETAKEELIDKLQAETKSAAKALFVTAGGKISPSQNPQIAETLAKMQRKYIENLNTDALEVACVTALENNKGTEDPLGKFCIDNLPNIIKGKANLLEAIIGRANAEKERIKKKDLILETVKELKNYINELNELLKAAKNIHSSSK